MSRRRCVRNGLGLGRALAVGAVLASTVLGGTAARAEYGHGAAGEMHASGMQHGPGMQHGVTSSSPAAGLRVTLNNLLAEHVYLAARATGAALGGRQAEFEAAAEALDGNSVDLAKAIGMAYGPEAEAAFLPLWRSHIGMVVEYTTGKATSDQARQDKAVADLLGYTQDFGAFLSAANENLPKETVTELVKEHVLTLKDVIDAQAERNTPRVYTSLRTAYAHMGHIADPLASATAAKLPDTFPGESGGAAADLRVTLNMLLAEHVYLASSATSGALGGRQPQFAAAAAELDNNSQDLANLIGTAYGPQAGAAFLPLWRSHIGMVVDYTTGKAINDQAMQDKAVADLLQYTEDFGAFLSGANENLPKATVAELVKSHALTLKDVIDAQAMQDEPAAFAAMRLAGGHMQMIADPLAEATVQKFPGLFGGTARLTPDSALVLADVTADKAAEIRLFAFQPGQLDVPAGGTLTWTNQDAIEHSVTQGTPGLPGGAFDSGLFGQGGSFTHTFDEPGTFAYFCARHPSMQGLVVVE